jgi:hypothetical protein
MVDRYTKAVLTVIAGALSMIAMHGFLPPAKAQDSSDAPMHVILDDVSLGAFNGITIDTDCGSCGN